MSNLVKYRPSKTRVAQSVALTIAAVFAGAGQAMAQADNYDLSPATEGITSQITSILTTVLPIAGGLLALTIGWKLLKKMTKSA